MFRRVKPAHKRETGVVFKRTCFIFLSIWAGLVATAFGGQQQAAVEPVIIEGSGDIAAVVEEYRQALDGQNNGGEPGSAAGGYREINWDSLPDELSAPNKYVSDFFNASSAPNARGIVLTTPGNGLEVSADSDNPYGALPRFGHINPAYADIFKTFSEERLFSPVGSNIVDATFYVPGTDIPAVVRGFGAVYTDVDTDHTAFEYFDINGNSLGKFATPITDAGLSFLGVAFPEPIVHRVRIAYGTTDLGPDDSSDNDVAVMDNFIYGEPQAAPLPGTAASTYIATFEQGPDSARAVIVVQAGQFDAYVCSLDDAFNLTTARWYKGALDAEGNFQAVSSDGVEFKGVVSADTFTGTVLNTDQETLAFQGGIVPADGPAGLYRGRGRYGDGEVVVGAVLDAEGGFASTVQYHDRFEFVSPVAPDPVQVSEDVLGVQLGTIGELIPVRRVTSLVPAIQAQIGADTNFSGNSWVQPQDPAQAGGGIDQSLVYGDILYGSSQQDLLIGRLGSDVLWGDDGDDVLIGGLEHFNPNKSDRKFGGPGNDILIWGVGDGSDLLDGGPGQDVLVLGLIGEVENGQTVFRVSEDEQAGEVFIDPATRLPQVDVTNAPGFCGVADRFHSADALQELQALGLHHLVRFFLREQADSFQAGSQNSDNGLRQTMHLRDIEYLICPSRDGGAIEVLDLTVSPPQPVELTTLLLKDRLRLVVR